jgi:hypothetical protein
MADENEKFTQTNEDYGQLESANNTAKQKSNKMNKSELNDSLDRNDTNLDDITFG